MGIRVCVAGATGWAGRPLVERIVQSREFSLSGAIARTTVGEDVGTALRRAPVGITVTASLDDALSQPTDVLVDYTSSDSVKPRVLAALAKGVRVVIGTSGLTAQDYQEIADSARRNGVGVIAGGNFSSPRLSQSTSHCSRHITSPPGR